ncbi:hypothetical protein [Spirosoma arcticum]
MIRYLIKDDVYYSLNDVTKWLVKEQLLTNKQSQSFAFQCKTHVVGKLADAYEQDQVYQHQEPIILPLNDYFVHWIVWAKLLILLPVEVRTHRKVDAITLLLDNPATVYQRAESGSGVNLVCMDDQVKLSVY